MKNAEPPMPCRRFLAGQEASSNTTAPFAVLEISKRELQMRSKVIYESDNPYVLYYSSMIT
jgi:hypothetical protein